MKILDRLRNALFEEEYVEVDEDPKTPKKEKPIVKKIILPDDKKEKGKKKEEAVFEEEEDDTSQKKEFKFPAILEDDFSALPEEKKEEPKEEKKKDSPKIEPKKEEKKEKLYSYTKEKKPKESGPYGVRNDDIRIDDYGSYEKKVEKKGFHPSPIISPVYGLIDENVIHEEIESKKEIRITSSYKLRRLDVDSVREKAYGGSDDIFEEELEPSKKEKMMDEEEQEEKVDAFLDITDTSPKVEKVTIGDAEEYFEDLGLEYNVDYKDVSHEKKVERKVDVKEEEREEEKEEASDNQNLFDLIELMYDEREGE